MKVLWSVGILIGSVLFACEENEPVQPDMGYEYFPLKVGAYLLYDVSETSILNNQETTINYELRSTVTDSVKSETGTVTYFITREKRTSATESWQPFETWSAQLSGNKLIQNESNVTFVKLTFPPSLNLKWDGNEFNNLPDNGNLFNDSKSTQYVISDISNSFSLPNGLLATEVITVTQNSFNDKFIGRDERTEVYSRNLGLVYREVIQLTYCTASDCYGQQKVSNGVIISQSLKSHGAI